MKRQFSLYIDAKIIEDLQKKNLNISSIVSQYLKSYAQSYEDKEDMLQEARKKEQEAEELRQQAEVFEKQRAYGLEKEQLEQKEKKISELIEKITLYTKTIVRLTEEQRTDEAEKYKKEKELLETELKNLNYENKP